VSIPIRFFSTSDDTSAAGALERDPGSASETMMRDRLLSSSAMSEWESILTCRSPEDHAQAPRPHIVADSDTGHIQNVA